MGWLFCADTRRSLIAERIRDEDTDAAQWRTLAHCTRGNVLWAVREVTVKATGEKQRFIACDLLAQSGGLWGYKDLEESMGPCYYTCPLKYLDMTVPTNILWRAQVSAYHARRQSCRR